MNNGFKCPHCDKFHKQGHPTREDVIGAIELHADSVTASRHRLFPDSEYMSSRSPFEYLTHILPNGAQLNYLDKGDFGPVLNYAFEHGKATREADIVELQKALDDMRKFVESEPSEQSIEPLIGYRVWSYVDGYLRSSVKSKYKWPYRKPLIRDVFDDAGIHCVKDYKRLPALMKEYCDNDLYAVPSVANPAGIGKNLGGLAVAGSISLWGEVKEHADGYLAQYAYLKEFYVGDDFDPLMAMQLEEDYGVPVNFREELSKEARKNSNKDAYMSYAFHFSSLARLFNTTPPWGSAPIRKQPGSANNYLVTGIPLLLLMP